jgi:hypothetical protein
MYSTIVSSPPRQNTVNDDRTSVTIELDEHPPVAHAQTQLRTADKPAQFGSSELVTDRVEGHAFAAPVLPA